MPEGGPGGVVAADAMDTAAGVG
ncbi:MAG: hypothetical protein QOE63_1977, partial [Acidimicrobiaceae bacterium]